MYHCFAWQSSVIVPEVKLAHFSVDLFEGDTTDDCAPVLYPDCDELEFEWAGDLPFGEFDELGPVV